MALWALPMLTALGPRDVTYHMEVMTLMPSQETWLRQCAGERDAWLMPSWNGRPRINKPPFTVWVNLIAWAGLRPETAGVDDLARRSRGVGLLFAALALAAIYSVAGRFGNREQAEASVLIAGLSFLFFKQARLASYDTCLMGLATAAVAAGLKALHAPNPSRSWNAICGIATAAAVLTKGPVALVFTAWPLAVLHGFSPGPRGRDWRGLWIALATASALALPWYIYAGSYVPDSARHWATEFRAARPEAQPPWYYLGLIGMVFPWSFWLLGTAGRAAPPGPARRMALLWFVCVFILLSIPAAKQQRYIAPLLPAAAWLTATAMQGNGRRWWHTAHASVLPVLSVAAALFFLAEPLLLRRGILPKPVLNLPPGSALLSGVILIALSGLAAKQMWRGRLKQGLWATAAWMAAAIAALTPAYDRQPGGNYAHRAAVERVAEMARGSPFFYLRTVSPENDREPDQKMLLYARRQIPGRTAEQLKMDPDACRAFIMADCDQADHALFAQLGLVHRMDFTDGRAPRRLYGPPPTGEPKSGSITAP